LSQTVSIWIVIIAALVAANLPFVADKLFGVVALKAGKTIGARLVELVVMYFVVGLIGVLLERRAGQVAPQGWEFYAVTGALFLVFAFPGFVWRYLVKHR
jgi:hypothetical protein